ncbi:D-serine ammonia-lyase [Anoxybacillus rupiensis]|jgi:D-serine dehydratase|uniref:Probable D-serine dehydratase n=1 Tax=Anoxybacteroides rupiense TaxID=311460 RepID=A0ABT5W4A4_9BACL|nr:D-serine ammonia-lyase [Anoxybacillus rupiensis]MDE8563395.1 D-serine ammonia-lyase [Anoxybacillus rupiensis]
MTQMIHGKELKDWLKDYPLLEQLISLEEAFWFNPAYQPFHAAISKRSFHLYDVQAAEERLKRFVPFISTVFPETRQANGIIESPLLEISGMQRLIGEVFGQHVPGKMLLKCDSHLPIAGSIKARGGIYEVLKHAEALALQHGLLSREEDYSVLAGDAFRSFFSQYTITVGSTGNLGLSIGIMGTKLGFRVNVHMSAEAKQWKKDLLRKNGAHVIEHSADYSTAVEQGRREAESDPNNYFIDDENSADLFLGYAVAALRLKQQFAEKGIVVDHEHPLFVYLPCGVGGAPGGIAFGLKLMFGDAVHCFFAEPTHSPCMLLGMMTGMHDQVCVQDFGIDGRTEADGLAVGRPSRFVGKTVEKLISGIYTVADRHLLMLLALMKDQEDIALEPSALAGVYGPVSLFMKGTSYIEQRQLSKRIKQATHLCWATGGNLVPEPEMKQYVEKGRTLYKEIAKQ